MRIRHSNFMLPAIILAATLCHSQTPAKEPTASISGHVTLSGKSAAGITVVATLRNSFSDNKTVAKATTDEDGNYKLTRLPAGRLVVAPRARAFVVETTVPYQPSGQTVNVTEGEEITKIDFTLLRGAVITGRITDAEGHPLIGESVTIASGDNNPERDNQMQMSNGRGNQTDDRGVYRIYGLRPGSYKVSVGLSAADGGGVSMMGMGGGQFLKTFYPSVQDESKATIIELKEGTEVANVDITVSKSEGGFSVSGRVIDAESQQPVAGFYVGHAAVNQSQQMEGMHFAGSQTDANGKFRFEGLRPGHWAVFTFARGENNASYSEPAQFEIFDSDVTGIEIKLRRGATVSGVAVFENNSDSTTAALLQGAGVGAEVDQTGIAAPSSAQARIGADGSFRLTGLAPGKVRLFVQRFPAPPKGLSLVRIEVAGVDQPDGIEVTAGANITGVRLVFAYGTGSIRGEIKIAGGTLPEGTILGASVRAAAGDNPRFGRSLEIDARHHFFLENVPPGTYELTLRAFTTNPNGSSPIQPVKQTISVSNGAETSVTLTIDVKGGNQ